MAGLWRVACWTPGGGRCDFPRLKLKQPAGMLFLPGRPYARLPRDIAPRTTGSLLHAQPQLPGRPHQRRRQYPHVVNALQLVAAYLTWAQCLARRASHSPRKAPSFAIRWSCTHRSVSCFGVHCSSCPSDRRHLGVEEQWCYLLHNCSSCAVQHTLRPARHIDRAPWHQMHIRRKPLFASVCQAGYLAGVALLRTAAVSAGVAQVHSKRGLVTCRRPRSACGAWSPVCPQHPTPALTCGAEC